MLGIAEKECMFSRVAGTDPDTYVYWEKRTSDIHKTHQDGDWSVYFSVRKSSLHESALYIFALGERVEVEHPTNPWLFLAN